MSRSRRAFLQQVSAAAAVGIVGRVPRPLLAATTPAELVPDLDEVPLHELAMVAVDAARDAGATFADVRVTAGQKISVSCRVDYRLGGVPKMGWPSVSMPMAYGIRAIVDGAWGFAGGFELTPDAVRAAARQAVTRARGNRPRRARTLELAPVRHAERGTWATPIEQDPFRVPVGEQADLAFAALAEAGRVKGVHTAATGFLWSRNKRVFASSEGALIVQRLAVAVPEAQVGVAGTPESLSAVESAPGLRFGPYGYEALARVNLKEELRDAAERAVAEARRPLPTSVEVGRYDLVFGAHAVAALLTSTIADAVNLERALGYDANGAGTSFAAPPAEILGQYKVASPLLTLRANRTQPHGAATVGWDDEGVPAGETTLVQDGVIVDYCTTRQTAVELAGWYRSRGRAVHAHGFASGAGDRVPGVRLPNLYMEPGKTATSVEDLIAGTKRGFYIERVGAFSDQQVLNTQAVTNPVHVREIRNGKLGARVRDLGFQFITPAFWRRMDAIGGAASRVEAVEGTGFIPPDPLQVPFATVHTVPARVREVNVVNYGGTV